MNRLFNWLCQWLRACTKPGTTALPFQFVSGLTRSRSELLIENALLRQQLIILKRQGKRSQFSWRERAILVFLATRLPHWRQCLLIVQPVTVLRWHRDLFRFVWRRKARPKRPPGRPKVDRAVIALLQQMTAENHTWGAKRIQGELRKIGVHVARSTVQHYMHRLRPPRSPSQSWSTFLHNHPRAIWACDLLQTYDVFFRAVFVFVIIDHASRRIVHARVTRHPADAWLAQQIREATPFDIGPRFLIRDNDGKYGHIFDRAIAATGMTPIRIPPHAPKANAVCERFWGSLRRECLDHLIILNERHLRHVVREYVHYYHDYRPHQEIDQHIPCGGVPPKANYSMSRVVAMPIPSGLHHHYHRDVA